MVSYTDRQTQADKQTDRQIGKEYNKGRVYNALILNIQLSNLIKNIYFLTYLITHYKIILINYIENN